MPHFLVVKHGALGDVVRTSYFAAPLRQRHGDDLRLSWITAPAALPLLRFNPHIDDLWTSFASAVPWSFDRVYSLDDESEAVAGVMGLKARRIVGALTDGEGRPGYTPETAGWFDMGLLSRFGKAEADRLKRENTKSHGEIFSGIFDVPGARPEFWGLPRLEAAAARDRRDAGVVIGVNPYAGGRWRSKELPPAELESLLHCLLGPCSPLGRDGRIYLLGAGADRQRNVQLAGILNDARVQVPATDDSVLRLAAVIASLDYLISSDSLALHLAIAQAIPFLAFFAPTSAVEIDDFGLGVKLLSTAADYCSYRPDADNASITAARILQLAARHRPGLFPAP